ncbi:hypothetical protein GCM10011611_47280 [Aliidongia dinghuensis]|uniref:Uncharacterized protein n=2 Tax=Aliidongia dinghuensis TaxID=1867774 RepID=A0A8J2YXN9_9PROT|nr:hypothetical protein GCM10011611_47280 [Aliidongia dinghuensis]
MLYNDQEVVAALASFYRKLGRPLTVGQIARYTVHNEDKITVSLAVETIDGEIVEHDISEADLAAAIIMQAIGAKIPLPAEADKRIVVIENQITLVIHKRRGKPDSGRVPGPRARPGARAEDAAREAR